MGDHRIIRGMIIDGSGDPGFIGQIRIEDGSIVEVKPAPAEAAADDVHIYAAGDSLILPGFVDIHCHGGGGGDFTDGKQALAESALLHHLAHGTTGMAATTMTTHFEQIEAALSVLEQFRQHHPIRSMLIGVHLEGPFISPRWPGAQNPQYIVPPAPGRLLEWLNRYPGLIRILTLAPEQPGAEELIRIAASHGVVPACGHTDATYEQIRTAIDWGLRHAVHCGNAMRGFHHREPGTFGAVLLHEELSTELILDGFHLHAAASALVMKCKPNQVCLITDAMRASGMTAGTYSLGGLQVTVGQGCARLEDGTLAGSVLTMDQALRNLVFGMQLSVPEAVPYVSSIPARIVGSQSKGTIAAGKSADLVLMDPRTLQVRQVMLGGRWTEELMRKPLSRPFKDV
jgi:N-acetylglucosamine-6-phosphate deacetylase